MKWCYKYPTIPVVRKCCFCVPARKGVIIFGYINLVFTLLAVTAFVHFLITEDTKTMEQYSVPLTFAILLVKIIMYIVLLTGAHKRNKRILIGYLYFSLLFMMISLAHDLAYFELQDYIENTVSFICVSMDLYLLLLVYSTIRGIEESSVHYVTHQNLS